ncbi:MAG: phosphosulfolactate synthase, partial [Kordiimonadaceae bacterium]|nr:phosphosulfolactate synthase [Kordiimonadaceae bacterium]
MSELAWGDIIKCPRSGRSAKPHETGITMVLDAGKGLYETEDILNLCGSFIDHWKLSFGTSVFMQTDAIKEKLQLLADHDVLTYPGGTLLEVALVDHHCKVFMKRARELGFTAVEISDGTIPIPRFRRKKIIDCAISENLIPVTEVGKKDPNNQPTPDQLAEEALEDLEWGAKWVVIEGREFGTGIGVFDMHGQVEEDQVERISKIMGDKVDRLIWEAPQKNQQAVLIKKFGTNVGLGNIPPDQILAVESLRNGLRFETLHEVTNYLLKSGRWDPNQTEDDIAKL